MIELLQGDCLEVLRGLPDKVARSCVTSPPYYGLRDYGEDGQIGLEATPEAYVARLVEVFREVRRVLTDDGTLWLNLGDSYGTGGSGQNFYDPKGERPGGGRVTVEGDLGYRKQGAVKGMHKQLLGIPWRVAFALQADGWYLRSDIIWHKPNAMPESVRDRPTKAHEYLFLLAKSERYYYDADAVKEPLAESTIKDRAGRSKRLKDYRDFTQYDRGSVGVGGRAPAGENGATRNRRTVWTIATKPYKGAHFAVFPEALVEPCILAGSAVGDTVLDPFCGSGTTGAVANRLGRSFVGIDLNAEYLDLARARIGVPVQTEMAAD